MVGLVYYPSGAGTAGRIAHADWDNMIDFLGGMTTSGQIYLEKLSDYARVQTTGATYAVENHSVTGTSHTDWPAAVSLTELGYLDGVATGIQVQIDGKAASVHTHGYVATGSDGTLRSLDLTVTGVAPLTVTGTTAVTNLNADLLDGKHIADIFTTGATIDADMLDTYHATHFMSSGFSIDFVHTGSSPTFVDVTANTGAFGAVTVGQSGTVANLSASFLEARGASEFITTGYSGDFVHTGSSPTFLNITTTATGIFSIITVTSTGTVTNLSVEHFAGSHVVDFVATGSSPTFVTVTANTGAFGDLTVTQTGTVANLSASYIDAIASTQIVTTGNTTLFAPSGHGTTQHDATVSKKRESYFQIMGTAALTSPSYTYYTTYGFWEYNAASWDHTAAYFEAIMKTSIVSQTGYCCLYNMTDATGVADSEITTVSTGYNLVKSGDLFGNLIDGKRYTWGMAANATGTVMIYQVRLRLAQSE